MSPALPAYIPFKFDAAPMNSSGFAVGVAAADEGAFDEVMRAAEVGFAMVEVLLNVDVTSATTSETVIVRVRVAVDVRVVVSSARARSGSRAYTRVEKRILMVVCVC